jgi:catechol 2,3-dioxygenase-like lactoylglutathione lyase family enzyme
VQVERIDFVSFFTQDIPRAKKFYAETLGLEIETEGEHDMEFRAGQVTLDIFDPSSQGQAFSPSPAGMALRVPDVAAARAPNWKRRASCSTARRSTRVFATWRSSRIRTGMP